MILVVCGPTGIGKTKLSVELAKIYNGEIINADSMQIYKGLDVGTAKVTKEEMQHIPHHLLDIKDVEEDYSVYDYQIDARKKIEEIKGKGKIPIFVGGTGYYLKAVFYDYEFVEEENSDSPYATLSNEELYEAIQVFDCGIPVDRNNRKRMLRLLEKLNTGWLPSLQEYRLLYDDVYFIGLTTDRDTLYERLDKRFDKMLVPLIDEVKAFYLKGIYSKALMTGIGYKELYLFFENKNSLQEMVERCKKNTRNYAKRQYTWFQNQMEVKWFSVHFDEFSKTIEEVVHYIEESRG